MPLHGPRVPDDLLAGARVVETLAEAIADCGLVLATTARTRDQYFRILEAREAATRMVAEARSGTGAVAVLFGTERFGLSNEQLLAAHALLRIPANPDYASLNIGMAAQLIAYEILMARHQPGMYQVEREAPLATPEQMERFLRAPAAGDGRKSAFVIARRAARASWGRIRRLFTRAELDGNEVNILRGLLTSVQSRRRKAGNEH